MKLNDMRKEPAIHTDFQDEKTIEHEMWSGMSLLLPKLHCEWNPTESCWALATHTGAYSNHTITRLQKTVPNDLEVVTIAKIQNCLGKMCKGLLLERNSKGTWKSAGKFTKSHTTPSRLNYLHRSLWATQAPAIHQWRRARWSQAHSAPPMHKATPWRQAQYICWCQHVPP